nr:immunoglobulin heavy chain junction region [Macaca mulatta]MOV35724.1 immunoglobulin heavy chain junction region [Macaca mulatta]
CARGYYGSGIDYW